MSRARARATVCIGGPWVLGHVIMGISAAAEETSALDQTSVQLRCDDDDDE